MQFKRIIKYKIVIAGYKIVAAFVYVCTKFLQTMLHICFEYRIGLVVKSS